jgi:hypothetical protein
VRSHAARSSPHQLQEELREGRRPVGELDDPPRAPHIGEHLLRIDVAGRAQAQDALAALDELDAGDSRQPLVRRAFEPELDPPPLRRVSQVVDVPGGDDATAVDDRDVLADVLHELELMAREENGGTAGRLAAEHLGERAHGEGIESRERLVEHEQLGLVQERRRKLGALLVPVRELLDLRAGAVGEVEPLEPLGRRRACRGRGEPV